MICTFKKQSGEIIIVWDADFKEIKPQPGDVLPLQGAWYRTVSVTAVDGGREYVMSEHPGPAAWSDR